MWRSIGKWYICNCEEMPSQKRNASSICSEDNCKKNLTARELVGLKYETKILQTMEHSSIIKAVDVFENKRTVKIVLELCEGGDLFDQMLKEKEKRLDEHKAAWMICRIARALKYLHEHHVCHRDLKPENILFTKEGHVKISDFGLAHYLKLPPHLHIMHTCCGTPHYVAPEVLGSDEYGVQVDFWSLGVILYIMLSGYQPFNSKFFNKTPFLFFFILKAFGSYFIALFALQRERFKGVIYTLCIRVLSPFA
ncbi:calcium/calmodulin-dependent protein kinase-like protein [Reticulomyxa filosa]|uniref:Calcium/calmodulin-dependent protein kinase-like protein n=1 Tax=Reticulomyxa filosa TaxID=46433 RepID=X6MNV3_RETFI|nr:calcium/calmodulin-dependent protein kinase-like protein [Reticulomyxa filosa]|eukprot:ETO15529.1 calcium/calmodulin-dependent protein kinase-like protein [Reticulomyxa filosa]